MNALREETLKAYQLAGYGERTQEAYLRQVRLLEDCCQKTADKITEEELKEYFLFRQNVSKWSPATMRISIAGLKFLFEKVLHREWPVLELVRARRERKIRTILSVDEVRHLLVCISTFHNRVFYTTLYSCGLRLEEALNLQIRDVLRDREQLHVHRGKGARDRLLPLPQHTLDLLREYWKTHRNGVWLFPARGQDGKRAPTADHPVTRTSAQGALRRAVKIAGLPYTDISPHTLRHCYATHLLEAGVSPHMVQRFLGHRQLETTLLYFHLTKKGQEEAYRMVNDLMEDL